MYLGLFLITMSTLTFEILLTRIFSVTLWYHFAFVAVSVAMFGMTLGALGVYLAKDRIARRSVRWWMAAAALALAVSMFASIAAHVSIATHSSLRLPLTFVVVAVPFTFSGFAVCLALTRFRTALARLYAVDLLGAALGCVLLVGLLAVLDGISAVAATAMITAGAAVILATREHRRLRAAAAVAFAALSCFALINNFTSHIEAPLMAVRWAKRGLEAPPILERWNAFSRLTVHDDAGGLPQGWGFSPGFRPTRLVRQLWLRMDSLAGTLLTGFNGDLRTIDYLQYDIPNLAHYLRPRSSVLIIGAGGGRDILSALYFKQPRISAVELNEDIIDIVNTKFGDFTGHLDQLPQVTLIHDEARSWVARQEQKFDIIQASWIDTWAATAAGAFVLTENSLYTVEAWRSFLRHLKPGGIITFTRQFEPAQPAEATRMVALGREALRSIGVTETRGHILLALNRHPQGTVVGGNATILLSPQPFTASDIARFRQVTANLQFEIGAAPDTPPEFQPDFAALASGVRLEELERHWPFRLDAPTDNQPFFFNMLRMAKLLDPEIRRAQIASPNLRAVSTLLSLLATVLVLSLAFIVVPLILAPKETRPQKRELPMVLYFAMIGLGFMLVEVSLLQRLTVFLGHPTYALSVVLFGLLLFSGCGSLLAGRFASTWRSGVAVLLGLFALLAVWGKLVPFVVESFASSHTPVRILIALALLLPIGLLMGMAFPLGMRAVGSRAESIGPWLWGINGGMSVLASVLAVAIALERGISASHWTGTYCYAVAALALALTSPSPGSSEPAESA